MKLYNTAAQDILYKNPLGQIIFLDNHDLSRFFSVVKEDINKYKIALGWLLTYRGIPQLYYGDEIGMKGFSNPDGLVRSDFLGGWKNDSIDKFTKEGRTRQENEVFDFVKTLANFRQKSSALKTGKMFQYIPENDLYTYCRYNNEEKIVCIINVGEEEKNIDLNTKYKEVVQGYSGVKNIISGKNENLKIVIKPKDIFIGFLTK